MKTVAIIQPNYIPWIGYFEIIKYVDCFIFLDDVQYTKRDWRNRNFISNNENTDILSIPVLSKGRSIQKINEVIVADKKWKQNHLKKIFQNYKKSKYFEEIYQFLSDVYYNINSDFLSDNVCMINEKICSYLNINSKIVKSSNLKSKGAKNEKLISLCEVVDAKIYISGPKATDYLDYESFKKKNIELKIIKYNQQKNYISNKAFKFTRNLSIIDLLFHAGKDSEKFLQDINLINYSNFNK